MWWVYDLTTHEFLHGGELVPSYDAATQGAAWYPVHPDQELERHDAASPTKKRLATIQERADRDAARATVTAQAAFDGERLVKAAAIWVAQKLGVPLATARQEILTIYRGL